ncbi:ETX/MTX2 family pore-forming toxin [Spiroplasma culicicola]|uniref:Chitinase n=1 Tax=Spiroplasma culicicola AES-1 TaxID=1276246 RepID=W6A7K6_9MOLU|nr:ETX/MTX2 family pore-forming toxin [Spiroplasma culicicola]AHI52966.1 hypothetical protein SCULI_v1c06250 [Spiroplasma culicicola AES-1]
MKLLLALLASSNFSLVATTNYQPENNQNIVTNLSQDQDDDFKNAIEYLDTVIEDYVKLEYGSEHPWLETEHLNITISIGYNPQIENNTKLIQKSIDKDVKNIIHEETDTLQNNTDIQQNINSSGFSQTYLNSVSYSVTKGVGFELAVPFEFANAKLNFNLNSTTVTTSTKQTTLTVPPQSVVVPAHQTRKVNYKVYEYTKVYNDILRIQPSNDVTLHIEVQNDDWLTNPLHFWTDDRLIDILSLSWGLGHHEVMDENNPIFVTESEVYINIPTKIQVVKNELNVVID